MWVGEFDWASLEFVGEGEIIHMPRDNDCNPVGAGRGGGASRARVLLVCCQCRACMRARGPAHATLEHAHDVGPTCPCHPGHCADLLQRGGRDVAGQRAPHLCQRRL